MKLDRGKQSAMKKAPPPRFISAATIFPPPQVYLPSAYVEWNYDNVEQLIELYEQRPWLYDTKLKEYHNSAV